MATKKYIDGMRLQSGEMIEIEMPYRIKRIGYVVKIPQDEIQTCDMKLNGEFKQINDSSRFTTTPFKEIKKIRRLEKEIKE